MSSKTGLKPQRQREPEVSDEVMDQSQLPLQLRYKKDESIIQAELAFKSLLDKAMRKLAASSHLNPKQIQEDVNLPLFTFLAQWVQSVHADIVAYVQAQLLGSFPEGLADEDAVLILDNLNEVSGFLASLSELPVYDKETLPGTGDVLETALAHMRERAAKAAELVNEVMEVIGELAGEEEEEEEEDDGPFDPEEPDQDVEAEEDAPPLNIR